VTVKPIVIGLLPYWNGSRDIYNHGESESLPLNIRIVNNNARSVCFNEICLTIKPRWFSKPVSLSIFNGVQVILPGGQFNFEYDLKLILNKYGDRKKISFHVNFGRAIIKSERISIREINSFVKTLYDYPC